MTEGSWRFSKSFGLVAGWGLVERALCGLKANEEVNGHDLERASTKLRGQSASILFEIQGTRCKHIVQ